MPIADAPGAGKPNPECANFTPRDESRVDPDNHQSVGVVISLGKFRTVDLGDFTYNRERELICPNNPVETVDLYLTSHHGIDQSGSPALVHGLHPRVAVMHNSTRKGGAIPPMQTLYTSPGLEDIWQLHWSYAAGVDYNTRRCSSQSRGSADPGQCTAQSSTYLRARTGTRRAASASSGSASCGSTARLARLASGRARLWRRSYRAGFFDQSLGSGRRLFHRHKHEKQFLQDLRGSEVVPR